MNKAELIEEVAHQTGLTRRQSNEAVDAITSTIVDTLARGEKVTLIGFGSFAVRRRTSRRGTNPLTGATLNLPDKDIPKFQPGRSLREAVE